MIWLHTAAGRGVLRCNRDEIGDRNRYRLNIARRDVELEHGRRPLRRQAGKRARGGARAQHYQPAAAQRVPACGRGALDHWLSSCTAAALNIRGSKVISISFHCS